MPVREDVASDRGEEGPVEHVLDVRGDDGGRLPVGHVVDVAVALREQQVRLVDGLDVVEVDPQEHLLDRLQRSSEPRLIEVEEVLSRREEELLGRQDGDVVVETQVPGRLQTLEGEPRALGHGAVHRAGLDHGTHERREVVVPDE